ncbi:MAG TPA: hypothetical protein VFI42_16270, partial [Thermomicrobiaceae bacterium]|nr:hypothetical protein [Thermomicrobiaceae bacterium]
MPTTNEHWSREPGRWEPALSPVAYAMVPSISTPCPAPDGRSVAYSRGYDGRNDLWVVDTMAGLPVQLTDQAALQGPDPNQRHAASIAWTPDSRHLIFASNKDGKLWQVPAAGGPSRVIDEGPGNHHSPAVSPDGTRVAYVAERGERGDIVVADLEGRALRIVSASDEYVLQPRWSPDGKSILYGQWPHYDMPWDERALVVADVESGERRIIAGGERVTNADAVWSPDGASIAFVSDREGEYGNLWTCDSDGANARRLVAEEAQHASPAWSPEGRRIAYTRNDDGDCQIWLWENGQTRRLTDEPGVHGDLSWLDGERILCTFSSPVQPADLSLIDAQTGARRQLTQSATGGILGAELVMPEHVAW